MRDLNEQKCAFCRTPGAASDKENIKRLNKRKEAGDVRAMYIIGCGFSEGSLGLPQDYDKALELYHRAGELGYAGAYFKIGNAYHYGRGVERDVKKADHYYELAAMRGAPEARHNLGYDESNACNWKRAVKHFTIAAGGGWNDSVKNIKLLYTNGYATKQDYKKTLLAYQAHLEEVRSEQRDNAAAFSVDEFKCY